MIQKIMPSDLDQVIKLMKNDSVRPFLQIEKDTLRKRVEAFLFNPNNVVFVSKHEEKVNGLIVGMVKSGKRKHLAEMVIAVSKSFWGKSIAFELLRVLESKLKAKKILRLELSSYVSNRRAINFYLKNGFFIEGCKTGSLMKEDGELDDEVMFGKVL
jgi:ribosomal protein S18 acetylase RimI-like enzyme